MAEHIFFKDRTDSLKGPFTERQVQEWYREKHFDSAFSFCFLAEGEDPSDSTEFVTLDILCDRNGDGCPFKKMTREEKNEVREELEKRIEQIGKEIVELKVNVESMAAIEKRLKKCEERIEKLHAVVPVDFAEKENTAPAASAANTVKPAAAKVAAAPEATEKKKKAEPKKDWMDEAVDFVLAYFDMLRKGDFGKAHALLASPIVALAEKRLAPECITADHPRFAEKLVKKMGESDHFYCAVCRMTMITPRQALIHAIGGEHYARAEHELGSPHVAKLVKKIIMIAGYAPDRWVNADMATREAERRKYGTNISNSALRPTEKFIRNLCDRVGEEVFPHNTALLPQEIVEIALPKFKNGLAAQIVAELDEHIGSAQTFCDLCKTRTGDREGYYTHLMRYDHTKTTAIIHTQTIAVNMVKGRGGQSSIDTGSEPTRRYAVYPAAGH